LLINVSKISKNTHQEKEGLKGKIVAKKKNKGNKKLKKIKS